MVKSNTRPQCQFQNNKTIHKPEPIRTGKFKEQSDSKATPLHINIEPPRFPKFNLAILLTLDLLRDFKLKH